MPLYRFRLILANRREPFVLAGVGAVVERTKEWAEGEESCEAVAIPIVMVDMHDGLTFLENRGGKDGTVSESLQSFLQLFRY